VTGVLARLAARRRARSAYFAAASGATASMKRLSRAGERANRAAALAELVEHLEVMAAVYTAAFGTDPNPNEDGRPMADSARSEVMLAGWLAAAEAGRVAVGTDHPAHRVLAELAGDAGPADRGRLCLDLYDVVYPEVGGQAAELLAALAWEYDRAASGTR
jgi:hypothetical protein